MTKKHRHGVSVRTMVESVMLSGSLSPGMQLARMREGMLGHQARQRSLPDAEAEVSVTGEVEGKTATLVVGGRIDLLYKRDGVCVVEELKLASASGLPDAPLPVHRAQAVCYGHLLDVPEAIIRVAYIHADGREAKAFEERLSAGDMETFFLTCALPYLVLVEQRLAWHAERDASVAALPFPFPDYREGQRSLSVQTFWAIRERKRLFAQAPTGIGKTMATLYPALKALTGGLSAQLFYLTARTTGQQNAHSAINRMRTAGLRVRTLVMTAKEKICPHTAASQAESWRCDMLRCPHADGFFDRLPAALSQMRQCEDWTREAVEMVAAAHVVCPFEFSLSLCEEADVVICDYNYAFDPAARIRRIFQFSRNVSLLVDEAHNLPDRGRDMLSAMLDSRALREIRREAGKVLGRKAPLYLALSALIRCVEAEGLEDGSLPPSLRACVTEAMDASLSSIQAFSSPELTRTLLSAMGAVDRFDGCYTVLREKSGRYVNMLLFCMDPAPYLREATRKLRGCVFFSATLTPLSAFRDAIGGTEEDALLALPSPFPVENLLVLRNGLSTRYRAREHTAPQVAAAILAMTAGRPGNYLACFPSYAYLDRVRAEIEATAQDSVTLHVQRGGMDEESRAAYLAAFSPRTEGRLLGLVVLGGIFGEGVDLPGDRLLGVAVVGVGLPQICQEREQMRGYYQRAFGDGFAHAYQYPGMNKVLQAVGRVIRTETDRGVALLIDDRFLTASYARLMPVWWGAAERVDSSEAIAVRTKAFWQHSG